MLLSVLQIWQRLDTNTKHSCLIYGLTIRLPLFFAGSCSYHLTHSRGNFSSPNYPNDYPLSVSCNWTISVTPGYFIYLHFEHFHLEHAYGASECPYDYVEIFDGSSSSSPLIAKRCAYQDSWCVYSTSNVLHVNFVSDVIIAQSGFSAYYERVHTRYPMCLHLNASKRMSDLIFMNYLPI